MSPDQKLNKLRHKLDTLQQENKHLKDENERLHRRIENAGYKELILLNQIIALQDQSNLSTNSPTSGA